MAHSTYQVVVVDDDPVETAAIAEAVQACSQQNRLAVRTLDDPHALETLVASPEETVDILIVDINLNIEGETGIDLVKRLFTPDCATQVIYVTGHIEYCTRVYRTDHVYFLTKPLVQEDVEDAINKAVVRLEACDNRPLTLEVGSRVLALSPRMIDYVESDRRKIRVHMGEEVVETYALLADIAQELPRSFLQCHKSFLVNMDHIVEFGTDHVTLRSGDRVPVSQRRRKGAHDEFLGFLSHQ